MPDTTVPSYTGVVNQSVFLEPLTGSSRPQNYLDRFPEEVYNKEIDSHLVKFMYALLGPAGIGWLRRNYLEARLIFEEFGLELFDLERFYGDPFRFGRILEEMYDEDPSGLLTHDQWNQIRVKDASYRNRAIDFLNGVRLGNTPLGMRFIARSGLNHEVEIFENYRTLFDWNSDKPLFLPYYGNTYSTEEMIVIPRRETPRSEVQTITIYGSPTGGTWTIKYDGQETVALPFDAPAHIENYRTFLNTSAAPALRISTALDDVTISVVNNSGDSALNDLVVFVDAVEEERYDHTDADISGLAQDINANSNIIMASALIDSVALALVGPQNLTSFSLGVQDALEALPNIGEGNVEVWGGPGPNKPYQVYFIRELSNRDILALSTTNSLTGGSSPAISTTESVSGVSTASEVVHISERARHNLQSAIDRVRPQTTIPTVNEGRGLRQPQIWSTVHASSRYASVLRYVTGNPNVNWPPDWIEPGEEVEAPKPPGPHKYKNFHHVASVKSYTDEALLEDGYDEGTWNNGRWSSEHVGPFTPLQQVLIPEFRALKSASLTYPARQILAKEPNPAFVTAQVERGGKTQSIYQGSYPDHFIGLKGTKPIHHTDQFWSSLEREEGDEYVELNLGPVRAVNFISFEITRKPVTVEVQVDRLDHAPRRHWEAVKYLESIRTFTFMPEYQSSWALGYIRFVNQDNSMVFTRHLRLRFLRHVTNESPFKNTDGTLEPWSIDVRNLRVGRNLEA